MESEHKFVLLLEGDVKIMTDYKTELLRLILENDNIEQAIVTASIIIDDLLKQNELPESQILSFHPVIGQKSSSF